MKNENVHKKSINIKNNAKIIKEEIRSFFFLRIDSSLSD